MYILSSFGAVVRCLAITDASLELEIFAQGAVIHTAGKIAFIVDTQTADV